MCITLIVIILLAINIAFASNAPAKIINCPAGSYAIGYKDDKPICKLEPTGCPYGDSIPLGPECDKFKPQEVKPVSEPQTLGTFVGSGK